MKIQTDMSLPTLPSGGRRLYRPIKLQSAALSSFWNKKNADKPDSLNIVPLDHCWTVSIFYHIITGSCLIHVQSNLWTQVVFLFRIRAVREKVWLAWSVLMSTRCTLLRTFQEWCNSISLTAETIHQSRVQEESVKLSNTKHLTAEKSSKYPR